MDVIGARAALLLLSASQWRTALGTRGGDFQHVRVSATARCAVSLQRGCSRGAMPTEFVGDAILLEMKPEPQRR
jgi:hypothetical protein